MALRSIETFNYRNLKGGTISCGASFVFFVGENGQGKSNILDALYTACYGSSFRRGTDAESACLGADNWRIQAQSADLGASGLNVITDTVQVSWLKNQKLIKENDKAIADRKYLVEKYPAIVFCHDDMEFVQGEPERRRFFFDQTAGLLDSVYIDQLRNYKKVLKMRNIALKERSLAVLDVLDLQLVSYGLYLQNQRFRLVNAFNKTFGTCFERISELGDTVGIEYRSSWKSDNEAALLVQLQTSRERELVMGTSLSGPHRDRYIFHDSFGDFAARASTGQKRLLSLVLRIAQAEHYYITRHRKPVLLLDDVLLELDPSKRKRFMDNLPEAEQSFFTFLPGEPYRDYINRDTMVYWTENGQCTRTEGG